MESIDYKKKIQLCEKLGAKKFQKIVFGVEQIKWKVVKKIFPNYIKLGDKMIEKNKNRQIKKAKNEIEVSRVRMNAALQKMAVRKEYNRKENQNYHINTNKPSEFIRELNWNKNIHVRNLKWNCVLLPASIAASCMGIGIAIPIAVYEALSMFINFECINIQNYNIYRLKRIENRLKEKEKKTEEKKIEEFKDAYEVIGKKIEEKKDIVSVDEIVNSINSKEQLIQLKELIRREKLQRESNVEIKGGKTK